MVTAPLVVVQEPQQPAGVSAGSAGPQSATGALRPLQLGALFLGVLQQSRTSTRPDLHLGLGRGRQILACCDSEAHGVSSAVGHFTDPDSETQIGDFPGSHD